MLSSLLHKQRNQDKKNMPEIDHITYILYRYLKELIQFMDKLENNKESNKALPPPPLPNRSSNSIQ